MKKRFYSALCVFALLLMPLAVTSNACLADDIANTEDIIFLEDGRVLHGKVISEDHSEVVFKVINRELNITTEMTFPAVEVTRIARDQPIEADADDAATANTIRIGESTAEERAQAWQSTFGSYKGASGDESLPSFYFVPMNGQMGTDINHQVYEWMVEDIRQHDPDYLVIVINTKYEEETTIFMNPDDAEREKNLESLDFLDRYRKLINLFRDDLGDIEQVVWIEDSEGVASIFAMAWDQIFMKPGGRFGGLASFQDVWAGLQGNVIGKFREAIMAMLKGFAEYGGYSLDLVEAMVIHDRMLSASWKGRKVDWRLDPTGDYLVDPGPLLTANFTSKTAEDFLISQGTAESLDDLALLLGLREYRIAGGRGNEIFDDHKRDWRRALERCQTLIEEIGQLGNSAADLGKRENADKRILAYMNQFEALEARMLHEYGFTKIALEIEIEVIREQRKAARRNNRNRGGDNGRGGAAGGGAAGGGRG